MADEIEQMNLVSRPTLRIVLRNRCFRLVQRVLITVYVYSNNLLFHNVTVTLLPFHIWFLGCIFFSWCQYLDDDLTFLTFFAEVRFCVQRKLNKTRLEDSLSEL